MTTETALKANPSPIVPISLSEDEEGGLDLGGLLRALRRKWWIVVGTALATTSLASVRVLTGTPSYVGQFEILVQAQSTETEVISDVPDTLTTRNEEVVDGDLLKVLKSPAVLQPVIDGIRDSSIRFCPPASNAATNYDPCYQRLANSLSVGTAGRGSQIIRASFRSGDPQIASTVLELVSEAYLEYSLASKQTDLQRGIEFVEQKLPDLRGKVDTLQTQLQNLRLDNNLIDPSSRGSQLASQISSFSQQLLEVQSQLRQTRANYAALQSSVNATPQEQLSSSVLSQNQRYQTLLNSLLDLDTQIAEASTIYLENSPDIEVLQEQRDNVVELLVQQGEQSQRETFNQIQELEERERSIQTTLAELNSGVDDLSGISRSFTDIERELQITTNNLNEFLAKREALQIDAAQREVPWEVVTPPTRPVAQAESLPQNLLLGAVLGLVLGPGLALLLDRSTGIVYGDDAIKRSTRLPILARIPTQEVFSGSEFQERFVESLQLVSANGAGADVAIANGHANYEPESIDEKGNSSYSAYSSDPFSESFRLLLTNLQRINFGKPTQSVTVSSTVPGEGKSTVAIYLAEAAAAMGKRVLLIDADLRSPQIHQYLELSNNKGLTTLFSGEPNPAIIQKLSSIPNLYVICSGSYQIEPSSVLASRSMQKLISKVKPLFDLIIFDSPPLLGQSDAYLVANHTDGLLLVAQSGKIKEPQIERAMEQLRLANINVLGVVSREK